MTKRKDTGENTITQDQIDEATAVLARFATGGATAEERDKAEALLEKALVAKSIEDDEEILK